MGRGFWVLGRVAPVNGSTRTPPLPILISTVMVTEETYALSATVCAILRSESWRDRNTREQITTPIPIMRRLGQIDYELERGRLGLEISAPGPYRDSRKLIYSAVQLRASGHVLLIAYDHLFNPYTVRMWGSDLNPVWGAQRQAILDLLLLSVED